MAKGIKRATEVRLNDILKNPIKTLTKADIEFLKKTHRALEFDIVKAHQSIDDNEAKQRLISMLLTSK